MTTHDALGEYFERRGIKPGDESVDDWLRERAYMILFAIADAASMDTSGCDTARRHHVIAGYDTTSESSGRRLGTRKRRMRAVPADVE
jgi:hypothetical protein